MKYLLRFLLLALGGLLLATNLSAQITKDTMLSMSDGVKIALRYYIPAVPKPAQGYPALLMVHGYGGNYTSIDNYARVYQANGYLCVSYTVRGQGVGTAYESGGAFSWFLGSRELEDCRTVLEWLRARSDVRPDRVGMEGYSQGGLTTWGALCGHFNLRCAAPVIAGPRMAESIMRNGCHNYFIVTALALTKPGNIVRPTGFIRDTLTPRTEQDDYEGVKQAFRIYDLQDKLSTITTPVFMQMGWQDDLFPCDEVFRAFHAVPSPKKLLIYDGGHSLPYNAQTTAYRLTQVLRFYAYWLKDSTQEAGVMNVDSAVCLEDAATHMLYAYNLKDSAIYMATNSPATIKLYCSQGGRLSSTVPLQNVANSALYIQNLSNDAYVVYRSQPLQQPFSIAAVRTSLLVNSTARKYQANVSLWDFDSLKNVYKSITRGGYHVRLSAAEKTGERKRIDYDLSPQLYTLAAGHQLHAVIKFGFAPLNRPSDEFGHVPYPPQESAIDTLLSLTDNPSWIELISQGKVQTVAVEESDNNAVTEEAAGAQVVSEDEYVLSTPLRGEVEVEIFDVNGRCLVQEGTNDATHYIFDTRALSRGVYALVFRARDTQQIVIKRVLVIH